MNLIKASKSAITVAKTYSKHPVMLGKSMGSGMAKAFNHLEGISGLNKTGAMLKYGSMAGGGAAGALYGHESGSGSNGRTMGYGLAGALAGMGGAKAWANKGMGKSVGEAFSGGFNKKWNNIYGPHLS